MMDRTDRHFRVLMRALMRRTLLYTEMVTTGAILHGDRDSLLGFSAIEHPIALQLGGDDPGALAQCARFAVERGYDELNLNVGCPSDRVQRGRFGAVLMKEPERVAACVAAMRAAVDVPITVKHRIGVDELDRYEDMLRFVDVVAAAGCDRFVVHARKAWLAGLSPKENREVPPLRYEDVFRLRAERPGLAVEINGGVRTLAAVESIQAHVDGVMIGRAAYADPYVLVDADQRVFGEAGPVVSRHAVVERMLPYVEAHVAAGGRLHVVSRHLLPLFGGQPGGRLWRRLISENACHASAGVEVIERALAAVPRPEAGALPA